MSDPIAPSSDTICTDLHSLWCFDVLVAYFEKREPVPAPFANADDSYALFVSWHTVKPGRKPGLRGCIGTFSPMKLVNGLRDYALISALKDSRFSPMRTSELPSLSCDVSLLTPFTPIDDPLAWTPGDHGIHITFPHPSDPSHLYNATYLPQICPEQGWTKEETIMSAISKAGYNKKVVVGDSVWQSLKVKVYGSVKAETTWKDYLEWKATRAESVVLVK